MANSALKLVGKVGQYKYTSPSVGRVDTSKPSTVRKPTTSSSSNSKSSNSPSIPIMQTGALTSVFSNSPPKTSSVRQSTKSTTSSIIQKAKNGYSALDTNFFGGFLPWGVSRASIRVSNTYEKAENTAKQLEANKQLWEQEFAMKQAENTYKYENALEESRLKSTLDLLDTSLLESWGIGVSPQEKLLRNAITSETFGEITPNISDQALQQAYTAQANDKGFLDKIGDIAETSSKWTTPVLAGIALIAGIYLFKQ